MQKTHFLRSVPAASLAALALLFAAPGASIAQTGRETPLPQARESQVAPFSGRIECEWRSRHIAGTAWGGGHNVNELFAHNTLSHPLPVGARLTWHYRAGGTLGPFGRDSEGAWPYSGEMVLHRAIPRGGFGKTSASEGGGLPIHDCQMQVSYGMRSR